MAETEHPEGDETAAIPVEELGLYEAIKRGAADEAGVTLVIYHRDGIQVVPLAEGQSVVVGRTRPADVAIRDSSLSRQHACIELAEGEVRVEDMGSTNGTWVAGERVEQAQLPVGAEVRLGRVVVGVHAPKAHEGHAAGLESHDRFVAQLEAEVDRARVFGRSLALLMVRGDATTGSRVSHWFPAIQGWLRTFDRLSLYSTDTTEILLPEASEEEAAKVARSIAESQDPPLHCGLALFPVHAGSAGELLEAARAGLKKATANTPVKVATGRSVRVRAMAAPSEPRGDTVVHSAAMKKVHSTCQRLAGSAIPVLIQGETGTGKELIARAIHESGKRRDKQLICVNCGAIPEQLVESTLFGHVKGAFTGADQQAKGVFESADGGTVLLDEIGELPAPAQAALLRVLESKKITRVGSTKEQAVDVRVLAATHRDLEAMCQAKEFREDLLYRLNAMTIKIPPLRERREEIEPLVRHFIAQANQANDCGVEGIDEAALHLLVHHDWPGNVRELRNAIERAVVIAPEPLIGVEDLPERVRQLRGEVDPVQGEETSAAAGELDLNLKAAVQRTEAQVILRALEHVGGDRKQAARCLGVSLRTLFSKMAQYGIKKGGFEQGNG